MVEMRHAPGGQSMRRRETMIADEDGDAHRRRADNCLRTRRGVQLLRRPANESNERMSERGQARVNRGQSGSSPISDGPRLERDETPRVRVRVRRDGGGEGRTDRQTDSWDASCALFARLVSGLRSGRDGGDCGLRVLGHVIAAFFLARPRTWMCLSTFLRFSQSAPTRDCAARSRREGRYSFICSKRRIIAGPQGARAGLAVPISFSVLSRFQFNSSWN